MTRTSFVVMSIVGLCVTPSLAQQDLIWGLQVGTPATDNFFGAAPDGAGGVIVGGHTFGLLGDSQFGRADVIIGRYNANGDQLWMTQFGTVENETSNNVCADGAGGVFMCGWTRGDLGGPFQGGSQDGWIGRFDADGGELWLEQIGTPEEEFAWNVLPDGSGGVFVTGWTRGDLGGRNAGADDSFVARYDADGKQLWITQFGTVVSDLSFAIASDGAGGVFVGGNTGGDLGGPNQGGVDAWIAHFGDDGNQIGGFVQFGTSEWDEVRGLVADGEGGVFASGRTEGELGEKHHGAADGFVARFDSSLNRLWLTQDGTSAREIWFSIIPDGHGGALISGFTEGDFAAENAGDFDVVIARYNDQGVVWKEQFGSPGFDVGSKIVSDHAGGVYVAGRAEDELFGEHHGNNDAILARFGTLGDLNCDGAFNGGDIDPFFLALGDPAAYAIAFPNCDPLLGDMNRDGRLDGGDIDPFFACLGGKCP